MNLTEDNKRMLQTEDIVLDCSPQNNPEKRRKHIYQTVDSVHD